MSVSRNPARMEVTVKIRSMATPVHALLDFKVSFVISGKEHLLHGSVYLRIYSMW